jgi:hypothetical protein
VLTPVAISGANVCTYKFTGTPVAPLMYFTLTFTNLNSSEVNAYAVAVVTANGTTGPIYQIGGSSPTTSTAITPIEVKEGYDMFTVFEPFHGYAISSTITIGR